MTKRTESGSHLVIAVIVLTLALAGALIYIFLQKTAQPAAPISTDDSTTNTRNAEPTLDKSITETSGLNLALKYPSSWKLVHSPYTVDAEWKSDQIEITSPDNSVTVRLDTHMNGIGGTCPDDDPAYKVTKIDKASVVQLPGYSVYSTYTTSSTRQTVDISLRNDDQFKDVMVGSQGCDVGMGVFKLDGTYNALAVILNNLSVIDAKQEYTADQVKSEANSTSAKTAIQIAQSLHR